jgi:anion-transporting  ArsA/GET3 family ATPase
MCLMNDAIILDTPSAISAFHLLSIKFALKMEARGMRHSRGSVAKMVREMIGSKTKNKAALLAEYEAWLSVNLPPPPQKV